MTTSHTVGDLCMPQAVLDDDSGRSVCVCELWGNAGTAACHCYAEFAANTKEELQVQQGILLGEAAGQEERLSHRNGRGGFLQHQEVLLLVRVLLACVVACFV